MVASSCSMVVGGCPNTPTVLLSSLTPTMLLHVPPQEGMLFFPRDSRTERTHAHSPLFRPLFFFSLLFFPSLFLSSWLCATRCFILVHHRCPQRLTSLGPCRTAHQPLLLLGWEKLKKEVQVTGTWTRKRKKKKPREIRCFAGTLYSLSHPRGGGGEVRTTPRNCHADVLSRNAAVG